MDGAAAHRTARAGRSPCARRAHPERVKRRGERRSPRPSFEPRSARLLSRDLRRSHVHPPHRRQCLCAGPCHPGRRLAVPAHDPLRHRGSRRVVYGDTKYDLQNQQELAAPVGDTKSDLKPATNVQTHVDRVGSLSAEQLTAAYGTTKPATPAAPSSASHDDNTNGWQIAALGRGSRPRRHRAGFRLPHQRAARGRGASAAERRVGAPPIRSHLSKPGERAPCSPAASPPAPVRCASPSPPWRPRSPRLRVRRPHSPQRRGRQPTGDTKNDLHVNAYEQAIAGDTKGHLPRAIAPAPSTHVVVGIGRSHEARRRGRRVRRRLADRRSRRGRPDRRRGARRRRRADRAHAPQHAAERVASQPRGAGPSAAPPLKASAS